MAAIHELLAGVRRQAEQDKAMLESMSASLRARLDFSFNPDDMADLLDRLREEHFEHLT
jgi:hypothetical protein